MRLRRFQQKARLSAASAIDQLRRILASQVDGAPARRLDLSELEDRILLSVSPAAVMAESAPSVEVAEVASPLETDAASLFETSSATADVSSSDSIQNPDTSGHASDETLSEPSSLTDLDEIASQILAEQDSPSEQAATEVVFVDEAAEDYEQLIADLQTQREAGRAVDYFVLEADSDGVDQIAETLQRYSNLDSVHIVSHGESGAVKLGATWLRIGSLDAYAGTIAGWGSAFSADGDILFYGCDLAANTRGEMLVHSIAVLTETDVAASTDDTGHSFFGGDWELEFATGRIEAELAFSDEAQANWGHLLNVTVDSSSVGTAGIGATSVNFSHTTSGADRLMLVAVSFGMDNGDSVSSINYNGSALTFVGARDNSDAASARVEIWSLLAPDVGNHAVDVSISGSNHKGATVGVITFNGVDQATALGSFQSAEGDSANPNANVTSAAGEVVFGVVAFSDSNDFDLMPGAGQTEHWDAFSGEANGSGTTEVGAALVVTDWTAPTSGKWVVGGVSVRPVATTPLVIDTNTDVADGDTSSISNLLASKGADGFISLREAIVAANNTSGTDTLHFNIAGSGPHTIALASALPSITDTIIIDATSEPDFVSTPVIELDGTLVAGNGLTLATGSEGSEVRGLAINQFGGDGIAITSFNNTIAGNFIGTSVTGTVDLGNAGDGVALSGGASGNIIGGTTAADRNIISGNGGDGVEINGATTTGNFVRGNYIGVDVTATSEIKNKAGVRIQNAANNTIGGTVAGAGNVIGKNNAEGIVISGGTAAGNLVQGNFIGTDESGTRALGNSKHGILITNIDEFASDIGAAHDNVIGGTVAGAGNTIAFNQRDGIAISFTAGNGNNNAIQQNLFYNNADESIDLLNDGVTLNDSNDGDAGPNTLQNFAVLSSANANATQVTIQGSLDTALASQNYTIEYFATSLPNANGYGGAERYLGSDTLMTDGSGDVSFFSTVLPVLVNNGEVVTATITDPTGNTSEFSQNIAVQYVAPELDLDANDDSGQSVDDFAVQWVSGSGPIGIADVDATLRDADSANLTSLVVTITNLLNNPNEILAADVTGTSITSNYDTGTGVLTLTGFDTAANYQQVLRTITYDNTAGSPATTDRTITFVASDGTNSSRVGTTTLTYNTTNDPPVTTLPATQITRFDNSLILSEDNGNAISIADLDAGGQQIEVTLTATDGTISLSNTIGVETLVNTATDNKQELPAVASNSAGDYVVVWQSQNQDGANFGVYAQIYNANGDKVGQEFLVNQTTSNSQEQVDVAMDETGNFVVVWSSAAQDSDASAGVYARRFDVTGTALSDEFRVNDTQLDTQEAPTIAMNSDGRFVIAWESVLGDLFRDVYVKAFNADGSVHVAETRVNPIAFADQQTEPAIGIDDSGNFVVAWRAAVQDTDSSVAVYAQRFDSNGTKLNTEFRVNTEATDVQETPAISMNAAGEFIITWQSKAQDDVDLSFGVYGQRYDSAGNTVGGEFLINSQTADSQEVPTVALRDDGTFAVAWQSKNQDGQQFGIFAQRFDASATKVGGEFQVNTYTTQAQEFADIAMDSDGDFVIAWQSAGQDGNQTGVYVQRYSDANSLNYITGTGQDDVTVTVRGRVDQINAALDGLEFKPTTGFVGSASLQVDVDDLGNSGPGGSQTDSDQLTIEVTGGLWLSTRNDVAGPSGAPGLNSWSDGTLLDFGGSGFDLEPGTTTGNFSNLFNLNSFAVDSDATIRAMHYVSSDITVGSTNAIPLLAGDVLLSTANSETLTSQNSLSVTSQDVFVFRPDTVGDYSSGTFLMLLDGVDGSSIHGISLVERTTTVGDTVLDAGDFLFASNSATPDLQLFETTDVGSGTTSGTISTLIAGADLGWGGVQLQGIELIESTATLAGTNLISGQLILTTDTSATVADNNLSVTGRDAFALTVTATTLGSGTAAGTAAVLFEGADVGLNIADEDVHGLAVIHAVAASNTPPTITSNGGGATAAVNVAENTTAVTTVTASDTDLPAQTLTYSISGGTDQSLFNIDSGSGVLTFASAPDFESPADANTDNVYEVTVQVSDGAGGTDTQDISVTVTDVSTIAYESFDYPAGSLEGSSGGTGWATGWSTTGGTSANVNATGLTSPTGTLPVAGGTAEMNTSSQFTQGRDLATSLGGDGTTAWFSYLLTPEDISFGGISLTLSHDGSGDYVTIGTSSNDFLITRNASTFGAPSIDNVLVQGQTYFLAVKVDFAAGNDTVTLYVDPTPGLGSPDSALTTQLTTADLGTFTQIGMIGGFSGNNSKIDEIRVGESFADVAPSTGPNQTPTADAGGAYVINEGETVNLVASASSDPDFDPLTFKWDLDNDGTFGEPGEPVTETPTVSWATLQSFGIDDDGVYTIGVEVDDGNGGLDTATTTLTVTNVTPTLMTTGSATTSVGSLFTLNLSAVDPGADSVSSWTINWGDGTIDTFAGNPSSVTHTYTNAGFTYNILASAVDEDGVHFQNELLVASSGNDRVLRFGPDASFLQAFATSDGSDYPVDVIIGPDGNTYLSGWTSNDVLRYDTTTGAFIDAFVPAGTGGLNSAAGLAFGSDGNLYVASRLTSEVLRFDGTTGAFIDAFVTAASGGLNQAEGLTFGPDGNLYVSDYQGDAVFKYDGTTGAFDSVFVSAGSGGLNRPEDLTFGPDGNLYVADDTGSSVLRYNGTTGAFIDAFVPSGSNGLASATGLAFGPDGNLYVGSWGTDSVKRFNGTTGAFIDNYIPSGSGGLLQTDYLNFVPGHQVSVTNNPPAITSDGGGATAAVNVAENTTAVTTVTATDTDLPAQTLSYSISGGADQTLFNIDSGSGVLTFVSAPDFETPTDANTDNIYHVTVQVSDGQGGTDSQNISVTVTPVNEAPVNTVPGLQVISADEPLVFSTANGNAVQISDVDAGSSPLQVTLAATNATLTLSGTTGLTFSTGDGTSDATMTFTGSLTSINSALQGLTLTPSPNFTGSASLQIATNDQGNTGAGGSLGDSDNVSVTVNAVSLTATNEFPVNSNTINVQETSSEARGSHRAVSIAPSGNYVVVWSSQSQDGSGFGVYGQRFNKNGVALGSEFLINQTTTNDQKWATVATDGTGNFVVAWSSQNQDGSGAGVYARRYDASGTALSGEFLVNTTTFLDQDSPSVAMADDGRFVVVWTGNGSGDSSGIFGRLYDRTGSAVGNEFLINTSTFGTQSDAAVAMNADGRFVAVWDDGGGFHGRRFDASGTPQGNQFNIDFSTSAGNGSVAMDSAGNFVATWRETIVDRAIFAQRYDSTGAAIGGQIGVNTTTLGDQTHPSIDVDEAGNFTIVWEGNGVGDANGVFGQKFDSSGTAIGAEFRINQTTTGGQQNASVALLDGDNFVVVWSGEGPGDTSGVFARQYTSGVNNAPTADSGGPYVINEGDSLILNGAASSDPDSDPLTYAWDLDNDGNYGEAGEPTTVSPTVSWATLQSFGITDDGSFTIGLQVDDGNGGVDTVTTMLTVNNVPPTITSSASVNVSENATTVLTVTATDSVDTVAYSLSGGVDQGLFTINPTTGALSFSAAPDFEAPADNDTNNVYQIEVTASDGDGGTDVQAISVGVTDLNDETPVITAAQSFNVSESAADGTSLGTVTATDADAGTTFSNWTITGGNTGGVFAINSSTGELTVADNTNLDFESTPAYVLSLTVSDGLNTSAVETVSIGVTDQNDNVPVIDAAQSFNVSEAAANGTSLGTITATDADAGTTFSNWTITSGNTDGIFAINSSTGELTVADNTNLDFESTPAYVLSLTVSDGTNTSSIETVSVSVLDANEAPSVSLSPTSSALSENADTSSAIVLAAISVTDDALGTNSLSLSGSEAADFEIVGGNLRLRAGTMLDFETKSTYNVTVEVNDPLVGSSPDDSQSFTLTINDVNDAPTTSGLPDVVVNEDSPNVPIDLTAAFSDAETASSLLTYTVVSNSNPTLFSGASISGGTLTLNFAANSHGSSVITVQAADPAGATVSTSFTVNVLPVNDAPAAVSDSYNVTENTLVVPASSGVLANDSDADGDALTALLITGPSNGSLVLLSDGGFTYTPDATFSGIDSFVYQPFDGTTTGPARSVSLNVTRVVAPPPSTPEVEATSPESVETTESSESGSSTESTEGETVETPVESAPAASEPVATSSSEQETEPEPAQPATEDDNDEELVGVFTEPVDAVAEFFNSESDRLELRDASNVRMASVTLQGPTGESSVSGDSLRSSLRFDDEDLSYLVSTEFIQELEQVQDEFAFDAAVPEWAAGTAVATTTGLSVGYIMWMLRGGYVLASVLSTMPVWQNVDPLPVLAALDDADDGDDESLESMIDRASSEADQSDNAEGHVAEGETDDDMRKEELV